MSKSELLKQIKIELLKETKYLKMLKYHNSMYVLKYFSLVFILYFFISFIDIHLINFLVINTTFAITYFIASILLLVLLCRIGYFENKLIYSLRIRNKCITLHDFYNLVLSKQDKLDGELWFTI